MKQAYSRAASRDAVNDLEFEDRTDCWPLEVLPRHAFIALTQTCLIRLAMGRVLNGMQLAGVFLLTTGVLISQSTQAEEAVEDKQVSAYSNTSVPNHYLVLAGKKWLHHRCCSGLWFDVHCVCSKCEYRVAVQENSRKPVSAVLQAVLGRCILLPFCLLISIGSIHQVFSSIWFVC